jgi:hypothetical protein
LKGSRLIWQFFVLLFIFICSHISPDWLGHI